MSNDKLSLGSFKLKKSDLENRILSKLLKKETDSFDNEREVYEQHSDNRNRLTKNEKESRIKALLKLKSKQGAEEQKDEARQSLWKDKEVVTSVSTEEKQKDSELPIYEEKGDKDKRNIAKKFTNARVIAADAKHKRYEKNKKFVISDKEHSRTYKVPKTFVKRERKKVVRKVKIRSVMTINDIAAKTFEPKERVIKTIESLDLGSDVEVKHEAIPPDIAQLIIEDLGHKAEIKLPNINQIIDTNNDDEILLQKRPPIVTIMGHVDHGKTTLIDALRDSNVASCEHGGITQHIGAYQIKSSDELITIIDTPGHVAFTAMRARGAKITDIAVLVIAADDSIKEQTVEAINHIQAADVPIIIAVNKIDKPTANVERVTNELLQYDIVAEEFGGDVLVVPISAKEKQNLDKLEEAILLQAELLNIKSNPNKGASGVILEAKLDKKSGPLVTLIIKSGTLRKGDIIIAGSHYCKVKAMIDCYGNHIREAKPSTPVEVLGFDDVAVSGDPFVIVKNEKDARNIIEFKSRNNQYMERSKDDLEDLFREEKKQVSFVVKADTQGSIEVIIDYINKFDLKEVDVSILHKAVGAITESDILLASASKASILSFCIKEDKKIAELAKKQGVIIRCYSVIYDLISDIKEILSGFIPSIKEEKSTGLAVVRDLFDISKTGKIAGCYVKDGVMRRDENVRLIRDSRVIYEGKIKAMRRFKQDEKEVKSGYECGILLENYGDIKIGDAIECFEVIETKQSL